MDIQIAKSLEGTKYITPIGLFYKNWGGVKGTSLKTKNPRFKDSRNGNSIMAPQAGLEPVTR